MVFFFSLLISKRLVNAKDIALALEKTGASIPGESNTYRYLKRITNRQSILGALLLTAIIALMTIATTVISNVFGITPVGRFSESFWYNPIFHLPLITFVVAIILTDIKEKIEMYRLMLNYEFMNKSGRKKNNDYEK